MAKDSKREKILVYLVTALSRIKEIRSDILRLQPTLADIELFADTQFPVVAVVGGFPVPVEVKRSARKTENVDAFKSQLDVEIFVYDRTDVGCDTRLSDLADEIWKNVWSDPTMDGNALYCACTFDGRPTPFPPYIAVRSVLSVSYLHSTGGI